MPNRSAQQRAFAVPEQHRLPARPTLRAVARDARACPPSLSLSPSFPLRCNTETASQLEVLPTRRVRLRKGEVLVRNGDAFTGLLAIRCGSCKAVVTAAGGGQQVAAYYLAGDILGAEAIFAGSHDSTITALEDSECCELPLDRIEALAREDATFQRSLSTMLSREIGRGRKVMLMLGSMRAEQRLAAYLLDLAERYRLLGYSPKAFVLRMTREEIGSYLGLSQETVSRLFSCFHAEGLVQVQGREVTLLDASALQRRVDEPLH